MKILNYLILLLSITIANTSYSKIYDFSEGNLISLLKEPSFSVEEKIRLIKNAKHHIHIATYFWDNSTIPMAMAKELIKANNRGVEVRILSSYIPSLTTDLLGKGRKSFKNAHSDAPFIYLDLKPGMGFKILHNVHEKIFLVDGEMAIIGGRNVSDSSLAGKDLEMKIQGPLVNQLQNHFQRLFDFMSDLKVKDDCKLKIKKQKCSTEILSYAFDISDDRYYPNQIVHQDGVKARLLTHDALINYKINEYKAYDRLNQSDDILDTIIKTKFKKLSGYAYFMTFSDRFYNYLLSNLKSGNEISLITNSLESAKFSSNKGYIYSLPITKSLVDNNINLFLWNPNQKLNYVHKKLLILDNEKIFFGSHNFGNGSTTVSNEIMIEFDSKEIAYELEKDFKYETSQEKITSKASIKQIENEIRLNRKMIKLLHVKPISKMIDELY